MLSENIPIKSIELLFSLPYPVIFTVGLQYIVFCICMLRGSTHYCAIASWVLSHHIVDFKGSRRIETAPTSIEVILRSTLVQSDEPSDLRGSPSPTTRHSCCACMS